MVNATNDKPLSKPVIFTVAALLLAIPIQPILGLNFLYDAAAAIFVGSRWFKYFQAAHALASDARQTAEKPQQERSGMPAQPAAGMTRADALDILDLKEPASAADVRAAYMRLMRQVHPDKGGSTYFAKRLNDAREVLLG